MSKRTPGAGADNENDDLKLMLGLFAIAIMLFFVATAFYDSQRYAINSIIITINSIFLYPIALIYPKAASMLEQMKNFNPEALRWEHITAITKEIGNIVKWPLILFNGLLFFIMIKKGNSIDKFKRNFNINKLLENNVKNFPCIAPIVGRNIIDEDPDVGPWRTARTPIQFVSENGLLVNKDTKKPFEKKLLLKKGLANMQSPLLEDNSKNILDEKKAYQIFVKQLGPTFNNIEELPDYQRGVAAALIAFGCGEKQKAIQLFDHMSLTFKEANIKKGKCVTKKNKANQKHSIDIADADEIIEKYKNDEDLLYATKKHNIYVRPWFHSLIVFARQKGVVSTAQFIWLKPMDRELFYTLNQVGGRTSFCETAGGWAHYYAEESLGQPIPTPEVNEAVISLKKALEETGWLNIEE